MASKIDGKVIIARLEFAAKAAEEFLNAFNQVKAEIEQIRPLTPYQVKKKEKEQRMQQIFIGIRQNRERHFAREKQRIEETMQAHNMTWKEAVSFISDKRSAIAKQAWKTRKENEKKN